VSDASQSRSAVVPAVAAVPEDQPIEGKSARQTTADEPAYRGVPLSECIKELELGRYDESSHFVHVMGRPEYAEKAFRHFGSRAASQLAGALRSDAVVVRYNAVEALRQIGPEARDAITALVTTSREDENLNVRRAAVQALGSMGLEAGPAIEELANMLGSTEPQFVPPHGFWRISDDARNALVEIGPEGFPIFVGRLKDKDRTVRLLAAAASGKFLTERDTVVPLLREMLKDAEPSVRAVAAESLGRLGPAARAAAPDLAGLLTDTGHYRIGVLYTGSTAVAAAKALASVGPTPAELPALIAALENDVQPKIRGNASAESSIDSVRWHAAESLGQLGPAAKSALVPLNKALRRTSIRCAVAVALLRIDPGRKGALTIVEECLSDDSDESKLCALRAFERYVTPGSECLATLKLQARLSHGHFRVLAAAIALKAAPDDVEMVGILREELSGGESSVWHPLDYETERWGVDFLNMLATLPAAADAALPAVLKNLHESSKN
jgi:HEAT repeat protein